VACAVVIDTDFSAAQQRPSHSGDAFVFEQLYVPISRQS